MSRSDLLPIEKAVEEKNNHCFKCSASPFFIIAVSGGIDSMSLLHIFKKLGINGLVSHINYQKRGTASDRDAELVEQMAYEWGFECHVVKVDPAEADGQNFQQWARDFRYKIFQNLVEEYNANGIAVAHHQEDQVETILQKIFRGAGLPSWSGMEVWNGHIYRPLLSIQQEQIKHYAESNAIPFRTDNSNLENSFARNFLRNEWLEKLSDFFPGWKKNVLRLSDNARNYNEAISWIARRVTDQERIKKTPFDALSAGLKRAVMLFLLKEKQPGIQISQDNLHRVNELSELQTGKKVELTPSWVVVRDRNFYLLTDQTQANIEPVVLERSDLETSPYELKDFVLAIDKYETPDFKHALYLDANKMNWPVTVRQWQDGDQLQPLGMSGHQSVAEHLTNRKVSAAYKDEALVIESFEETICAIIFPPIKNQSSPGTVSELVKCDSQTTACLTIKDRK